MSVHRFPHHLRMVEPSEPAPRYELPDLHEMLAENFGTVDPEAESFVWRAFVGGAICGLVAGMLAVLVPALIIAWVVA